MSMCRIYGFISNGSDRLDLTMKYVSQAQLHGGPDSQTMQVKETYGIGCNRLAIMDPTGGVQPYDSIPGVYAVLNGEIYNHDELRRNLECDGYHFSDRCDGIIIPALYHKYGPTFPEYLDGMFSIAIIDTREKTPFLLLITDSSGIKPLYYTQVLDTSSLAFATEVPALLKFGIASGSIWHPGLDHFLTTRCVTGSRTLLDNVYSLPPGSILQKKIGENAVITQYSSKINYEGPIPKSFNEASEIFRELLAAEVKKLAKADAKVCSVNSGGLDSSLVTALLHHNNQGKTTSFHVKTDGNWPFDESMFAHKLAKTYNMDHYEAIIKPDEIHELFTKMSYHLGQPNCAPHSLSTYRLFEKVHKMGFRVALTGEGSDEYFCGHERMGLAINDTRSDWAARYLNCISPCTEITRKSLYSKEFSALLQNSNENAQDQMIQILHTAETSRGASVRAFEQRYSLPYYILHRLEPLAMAWGVEVRVPFCQRKIVDFSWKLNPNFLFGEGRGKAVVYKAAQGIVPEIILNRPKQPFTLPVIYLMQKGSSLINYCKDILYSSSVLESKLFNIKGVMQLFDNQEKNPSKETSFTIWALTNFAVWLDIIQKENKISVKN
jgi:asparagine synthase (glutamine-hydrolysing)